MPRAMRRSAHPKDVKTRAAALLAAGLRARAKPCRVGASEHRELVEAMAEQGGTPNLIAEVLKDQLRAPFASTTVERHIHRKCLCFRQDYHASAAARRVTTVLT